MMKIVIAGYGEMFRALIEGVLNSSHELVGVFRHENVIFTPLRKFCRDIIMPSDDYNFIKSRNLYEIKAKSVNSKLFEAELIRLKTDIVLVGSWSEKFSVKTINTPAKACINVHPSLLPQYRGPNPYLQVILNGEKQTGVTFHLMESNYDSGSILYQIPVNILKDDTGKRLKYRCCDAAKKEVTVLLNNFEQKYKNKIKQDENKASYQHHISLSESILDFSKETAAEIDRRIRALTPWLNCHICFKDEFFTFAGCNICNLNSDKPPGTIVGKTNNSLFIVCKDKAVIEFYSLRIKRPFSKQLTKFYLDKIIKVNDKVL